MIDPLLHKLFLLCALLALLMFTLVVIEAYFND